VGWNRFSKQLFQAAMARTKRNYPKRSAVPYGTLLLSTKKKPKSLSPKLRRFLFIRAMQSATRELLKVAQRASAAPACHGHGFFAVPPVR
jgi:hypothetical protein